MCASSLQGAKAFLVSSQPWKDWLHHCWKARLPRPRPTDGCTGSPPPLLEQAEGLLKGCPSILISLQAASPEGKAGHCGECHERRQRLLRAGKASCKEEKACITSESSEGFCRAAKGVQFISEQWHAEERLCPPLCSGLVCTRKGRLAQKSRWRSTSLRSYLHHSWVQVGPTLPVRRSSVKDYKLQGWSGKGGQVPPSTAKHQETRHNWFLQVTLFIQGKTRFNYFKESESISPLSIGEEGICATGSAAVLENLQK